jgi:transcriptional regulator with XRE-family HTH domain
MTTLLYADTETLVEPRLDIMRARLRWARRRKGWSLRRISVETGISWSVIAHFEEGVSTRMSLPSVLVLADALGVSLDWLLGLTLDTPTPEDTAAADAGEDPWPTRPLRHGSVYTYRAHKCRCDACVRAFSIARARWKESERLYGES